MTSPVSGFTRCSRQPSPANTPESNHATNVSSSSNCTGVPAGSPPGQISSRLRTPIARPSPFGAGAARSASETFVNGCSTARGAETVSGSRYKNANPSPGRRVASQHAPLPSGHRLRAGDCGMPGNSRGSSTSSSVALSNWCSHERRSPSGDSSENPDVSTSRREPSAESAISRGDPAPCIGSPGGATVVSVTMARVRSSMIATTTPSGPRQSTQARWPDASGSACTGTPGIRHDARGDLSKPVDRSNSRRVTSPASGVASGVSNTRTGIGNAPGRGAAQPKAWSGASSSPAPSAEIIPSGFNDTALMAASRVDQPSGCGHSRRVVRNAQAPSGQAARRVTHSMPGNAACHGRTSPRVMSARCRVWRVSSRDAARADVRTSRGCADASAIRTAIPKTTAMWFQVFTGFPAFVPPGTSAPL